jgi:excisionase family DNA binding protein
MRSHAWGPRMSRHRSLFPIAVSVREAAECLGVSRRVIEMAIANGELKFRTPNWGARRGRLLVSEITNWVATHWKEVNHGR